jgi:PmbA protein
MTATSLTESQLGQELLSLALRHVRDAEVFWARDEALTVGQTDHHPPDIGERSSEYLALRVIQNGRIGFAAQAAPLAAAQLEGLFAKASAATASGPPAPPTFWKERGPGPAVEVYDPRLASLDRDDLSRLSRQAVLRLGDMLGSVPRSVAIRRSIRRHMLLSRVDEKRAEKTLLQVHLQTGPLLKQPLQLVENFASCRWPDRPLAGLGDIAWKTAFSKQRRELDTGNYPVVFSARAVAPLLRWLCAALCGDRVTSASMIGETRFDPRLSVIDDGLMEWAPASGGFDAEGVPRRRQVLIDKGVVSGVLLDLSNAARLGLEPTGSAARSMQQAPHAAVSSLEVPGGRQAFDDLLEACEGGVYVDALDEEATPAADGALSVPIKSAFWIAGGRPVAYLAPVRLEGDIAELFTHHLTAIGSDVTWVGTARCPSMALQRVRLVAS